MLSVLRVLRKCVVIIRIPRKKRKVDLHLRLRIENIQIKNNTNQNI